MGFQVGLILVVVLALSVWALGFAVRQSRRPKSFKLTPQQLSSLAQPYRQHMGEALSIHKDVMAQAATAPKVLQRELTDLSKRLEHLLERALPRARHGTQLLSYLLELSPGEAQYQQTKDAAKQIEAELEDFVISFKTLRGKVYQLLTNASDLSKDSYLKQDLEDALIDISALESAFSDVYKEL